MSLIKSFYEEIAERESLYLGECQHDIGSFDEDNNIELCLMGDHYRKLGTELWYELYEEVTTNE